MHLTPHFHVAQYSRRVRWFMAIAWLLILLKCLVVRWAIAYWHMPFHAMWIIAPTLVFAALATVLWVTHQPE